MKSRTLNAGTTSILLIALLVGAGLSACNTVRGVGEDTEAAGKVLQKEASEHADDDEAEDERGESL